MTTYKMIRIYSKTSTEIILLATIWFTSTAASSNTSGIFQKINLCLSMKTVFILALSVYTSHMYVDGVTTTLSPMSCTTEGKITYTGVPNDIISVASSCGHATLNKSNKTLVITGCDVGKTATVNLYKKDVPSRPDPTPSFVLDGSGALQLTCNEVPDGKVYFVNVSFIESITPTNVTAIAQIALTMSLNDHSKSTSSTNEVVLGQQYDLKISGGGSHFLKINTCNAAGTDSITDTVTVYDSSQGDDSINLINPENVNTKNGKLTATMTGFRLVAASDIFLKCDLYVCNKITPCPPPPTSPGRKRKRTRPNLKTASVHFKVMDPRLTQAANGARDINFAGKNVLTLVLVAVATHLSF